MNNIKEKEMIILISRLFIFNLDFHVFTTFFIYGRADYKRIN